MADEDAESNLVREASEGDSAAFTTLFNRYYSMIHAFAYRLSLDQDMAEDIA